MDPKSAEWTRVLKERGHTPILDETGDLDYFALDADYHNGPGCSVCGWSCCWHCEHVATEAIPETCDH